MTEPQTPPNPLRWVIQHLLDEVRHWPEQVQDDLGYELERVQWNNQPIHFREMPTIWSGVREIKIVEDATKSQYRALYIAKYNEAVYVLHVITAKTSEKTPPADIELTKMRLKALNKWREEQCADKKRK